MFKFHTELTYDVSLDFCSPGWSSDNPYSFRQWYNEDITGKPNLLIVVGDSWSWGDHLGEIDWKTKFDDPVRLTQNYGRKLSDSLNADWVGLTKPGASNYWMWRRLKEVLPEIHRVREQYRRIFIVVTLTEDLRETWYANEYETLYSDYGIDVIGKYTELYSGSASLMEFMAKTQEFLFKNFEDLFREIPFAKPVVSRAFTDNLVTTEHLLEKTWCDVFQDNVQYTDYQKPVMFLGQMAINPLLEKIFPSQGKDKELQSKMEFIELMDKVATRWNFLAHSKYNMFGSTNHPTPEGHSLWADYLYAQLTK